MCYKTKTSHIDGTPYFLNYGARRTRSSAISYRGNQGIGKDFFTFMLPVQDMSGQKRKVNLPRNYHVFLYLEGEKK